MQQNEIEQKITTFLIKHRGVKAGTFTTEEEIFSNGVIDSLTTLELTIFIEDEFGIAVDEEKIACLGSIRKAAASIVQAASTGR